jgi:hypothetical protein
MDLLLDVFPPPWLHGAMENATNNPVEKDPRTPTNTAPEVTGDDLVITKTTRRAAGSGTWVIGTVHGHRFEALVFPGHAEVADYELGDSRLSKLFLRRLSDGADVYLWDRGLDRAPADATAAAVVDFLAAGLAEHVYGS